MGCRRLQLHQPRLARRFWPMGAKPVIPTLRHESAVARPAWIYQNRNRVEPPWARMKEWRAVDTRYTRAVKRIKTARCFTDVLCLAAALD